MFIDRDTEATRPANLPVRLSTYLQRHPTWPCALGTVGLAAAGSGIWYHPGWWLMAVAAACLLFIYVKYVQARFAKGMLCPGVVISKDPFQVAVLTDLAYDGVNSYPVVKVISPVPPGPRYEVGLRLAAVTLYTGVAPAGHWGDCDPVLALDANDLPILHQGLMQRISEVEWDELSRAVLELPRPFKCGLFPVRRRLAAAV